MTKACDKMEEKYMKAKLMALMLAVGLGVTGVAVTAQASTEESGCGDPDWYKSTTTEFVDADFCNPEGHYSTYVTKTFCSKCNMYVDEITTVKFERHDYEQIFEDNGRVKLVCTACNDSYYQF